MNHDEVGRGDFVLLDEISSQSFIHNLRIRLVNFDTCTQTVPVPLVFFSLINVSNAQGGTERALALREVGPKVQATVT